jgi:hypothetical protein
LQTSYKDEARKNQEKFKVLISLDCVWNRFCLAPPPPPRPLTKAISRPTHVKI